MKNLKQKIILGLISFGLLLVGATSGFNNSSNESIKENTYEILDESENLDKNNETNNGIHIMLERPSLNLSGAGTSTSPYLINNLDDFKDFATYINGVPVASRTYAYYLLTADITINYNHYISVGKNEDYAFKGSFSGQDASDPTKSHKISITYPFTLNEESASLDRDHFYGLFGCVNDACFEYLDVVANLYLNYLTDSSGDFGLVYFGGLFGGTGTVSSSLNNVNVNSTLSVESMEPASEDVLGDALYLGGIAGVAKIKEISNSTLTSNIKCFDELNEKHYTSINNSNITKFTAIDYFMKAIANASIGGAFGKLIFDNATNVYSMNNKFNVGSFSIGANNSYFLIYKCNVGLFVGELANTADETTLKLNEFTFSNISIKLINVTEDATDSYLNFGGFIGYVSCENKTITFEKCFVNFNSDINLDTSGGLVTNNIGLVFGYRKYNRTIFNNSYFVFEGFTINDANSKTLNFGLLVGSVVGLSEYSSDESYFFTNSYIYEESGELKLTKNGTSTINSNLLFGTKTLFFGMDIVGYFYINASATSDLDLSRIAGTSLVTNGESNRIIFTNSTIDEGRTNKIKPFVVSDLVNLNTYVDNYNGHITSDIDKYYNWSLDKNNSGYPVFATKLTFVAEGFLDREVYMVVPDGIFNETILTYENKEIEGYYNQFEDNTYFRETTLDKIKLIRYPSTIYIKFIEVVEPDPGDDEEETGPSIPIGTEFDIIYNAKDGTINDTNYPTTYICGVGATLPINVTKVNYDFSGWSYRNLNGVIITSISSRQYGDVYLNANYCINANAKKYTIEYVNNEGKINGDYKTSYLDEEVELPTDVTSDYGTFAGWYDNPEFTGRRIYKISNTDTGNKTYYARFIYNQYTISYYLYNGSNNDNPILATYTYGQEVTLMSDVIKDGYTFLGFSETKDDSTNIVTKINKGESGNKVYYAIYKENSKSCNLWWLWLLLILILILVGGGVGYYIYKKKHNKKTA